MNKLLIAAGIATVALSAPVAAQNFEGPFVGAQIGYNHDSYGKVDSRFGRLAIDGNRDSFTGGAYAGYDHHLTDRIVDRDGRTVDRIQPREMSQVMSGESAGEVADMMGKVVEEGTGTAAALEGISVGGKTGTAEVDRPCGPNQVWFIAFAPAPDPRIAVAVTIECSTGTGGEVAAPIAKAVMEEALR